ncbi:MAG: nucleotidyltransferase family protein, partial [Acidobacteriota bacterium]
GTTMAVFMNGARDEAIAVLTDQQASTVTGVPLSTTALADVRFRKDESHWRWRMKRVEELAGYLDPARFGIKAVYVFGSTKEATAGPQSDIDLLVHFQGIPAQEKELMAWLEGWSLCLSEENYQRTGHKTNGLLDVHVVTDSDISNRTSFASKIGSITDPPRPLPLGRNVKKRPMNTDDTDEHAR